MSAFASVLSSVLGCATAMLDNRLTASAVAIPARFEWGASGLEGFTGRYRLWVGVGRVGFGCGSRSRRGSIGGVRFASRRARVGFAENRVRGLEVGLDQRVLRRIGLLVG